MRISKEVKTGRFISFDNWEFGTDFDGRLYARHYINNNNGTYYRMITTIFFNTKNEGNEFFKRKIAEGYIK